MAVEGRSKEKNNILERLRHMMMMAPIIMQVEIYCYLIFYKKKKRISKKYNQIHNNTL